MTTTVLEWKQFAPTEYIAICIVLMVGRIGPGANHDLENSVIAVHPKKVVHRCLSVRPGLHPRVALGVVEQVQAPQVVVHLHNIQVAAAEVGHDVVELVIQLLGLCCHVACRLFK